MKTWHRYTTTHATWPAVDISKSGNNLT